MIDRDQMQAWLNEVQDYPGGPDSADRAIRATNRTKHSLAQLAPGSMFDTEPAQMVVILEMLADD